MRVLRIGLTGGIGSGKSTVAKLLRDAGITVFDADDVSRQVATWPQVRREVAQRLGAEYVTEEGLNRPKLAELVFSNPTARKALNTIIHPKVRQEMQRLEGELQRQGQVLVVQDIPLLFETEQAKNFDFTLFVDAPLETRIRRVMARDGASREQVLARENAQMPMSEKRKLATHTITNDGDGAHLAAQVTAFLDELGYFDD